LSDKELYRERQRRVCLWLREQEIAAAVLEDREGRRDSSLRYLSGMPGDSLLFLFPGRDGREDRTILLPWDRILADRLARVDEIISYEDFGRKLETALAGLLRRENPGKGARVELPSALPAWQLEGIRKEHPDREFLCRPDGLGNRLSAMRTVKDRGEIDLIREAARLTNRLLEELDMGIRKGDVSTEMDAALFLERRSRTLGCDGMGFETLAAGPGRSWGIHAFPPYTAGPFAGPGLSLADFGVRYGGYVSDVTVSFVRGPLSKEQERMVALVEEAYRLAEGLLAPGTSTVTVARGVNDFFASKGVNMPHLLGHGIGLDAHEGPYFRTGEATAEPLVPGMVLTLEPGLYHEKWGGVRWENDYLITETGAECLTSSRIIRLPGRI